jgi:hypothetical protein
MRSRTVLTHWPLILAASILIACCALALRAATAATDGHLIYALDDAYIHMAMAKNFARHGVWGCTPFHFSSSSSSPLWTLLLGVVYFLTGVRDSTPLVLNVLLGVGTLALTARALHRFGVPAPLRASALVGVVIAAMLPGLVLMGMEHVLHLLLTVWFGAVAAEMLVAPGQTRGRQFLTLSLLAMLLATSRYEGFFLVAIVCLSFVIRRRPWTGIVVGTAAFVPVVAFGAISVLNGSLFLPNSLLFKAGGASASALETLLKPFGPEDVAFYRNNPTLLALVALGLGAALLHGLRSRSLWRAEVLLPLWLALMIVLHGHFVFSSTFWAYRYDAYLLGFAVVAAALALHAPGAGRMRAASPRWSVLPAVALIGAVAAVGQPRAAVTAEAEIGGALNTYLEHYEASQFVRAYYPGDTAVVNDLGAVTYYTETQILDLVGLGNIEPVLIMRRTGAYTAEDVAAWTDAYGPRLAIIQLDWSWVAPRIPREWRKVAEVAVPPHGHRVGFFAIDPSAAALLAAHVEYHYTVVRAAAGYRVQRF